MTAPSAGPAEPRVEPVVDDQGAALDAEDATLAQALAEAEAGRAERVAQVDADEAALREARAALWHVSRDFGGGRDWAGPTGAQHTPESEAARREREAAQRRAEVAVELAEQQALASRGVWLAGERRRSDLLQARARLGQRRAQLGLERERARRAAAAAGAGSDAMRALKRRLLGLGGAGG